MSRHSVLTFNHDSRGMQKHLTGQCQAHKAGVRRNVMQLSRNSPKHTNTPGSRARIRRRLLGTPQSAHHAAEHAHKGVQVGHGHAVDLLHELQRVQAVAVRGRAVVPARDEHAAVLWQEAALAHRPVRRLRGAVSSDIGRGVATRNHKSEALNVHVYRTLLSKPRQSHATCLGP